MKKEQILNAILNKKMFNHTLTDWAIDMFFNFIGGEYFSYPRNEEKLKEYNNFILNLIDLSQNQDKPKQAYKKARKYIISNFCEALTLEFNCSYGYAQKVVVKAFGLKCLETINNDLISKMFSYNQNALENAFTPCDIALNNNQIKNGYFKNS